MLRLLQKILLSFCLLAILWAGGFLWFIGQMPVEPSHDDTHADVIVVLTGGAGRLEYGFRLLAEGKGKALFISGVSKAATVNDLVALVEPPVRKEVKRLPITLGRDAVNTIGNAEETARWIREKNYKTIHLVTSNYHMPRSISEFRQTL